MRTRESEEMYLETIYLLSKTLPVVRSIDIAADLGYAKPSVCRAIKLLQQRGYAKVNESGGIILTENGRKKAEGIFERHEVLTALFEKMGVNRQTAEKDACRIEHVISDEMFCAVKEFVRQGK